MTLLSKLFICVKLNPLLDREMKVYYVTLVSKHGINIKTMCWNYVLKFRNTKWHLLQGYLGAEAISTRLHKQSVASHCFGLVYSLFYLTFLGK